LPGDEAGGGAVGLSAPVRDLGNRMMMLVDISMVAGVVPNRRRNRLLDVREATVSAVMANDREATFWRSQHCGRSMFTLR